MCGLAGFLLGNQVEFVSPAYMHWQRSGELIMMVLLGGTGTLYGPILGALAYLLLEEGLSRLTEHWKVILGPLLVLLVLFGRGGIAGAIERWRRGELSVARLRADVGWLREHDAHPRHQGMARRGRDLPAAASTGACRSRGKAWRALAARWRRWNMALGEALVSLVLVVDRSITGPSRAGGGDERSRPAPGADRASRSARSRSPIA